MFDKDIHVLSTRSRIDNSSKSSKNLEKQESSFTWLFYEKGWQNRTGKLLALTGQELE